MKISWRMALAITLLLGPMGGTSPALETGGGLKQTVYVPVYSHIYYSSKPLTINLAATLSIRNTDLSHSITVTSVKYYDEKGKLLKEHQKEPLSLPPLASKDFFIRESDVAGGIGASFLVEWKSDQQVSEPLIEAVMIGAAGTPLGISFVTRGRVIKGSP
ncbi:MAG: DUF3124 domain-containing protein [Deltaproteobacteria bacterium]|nr:DUF3124 domain-containing protein [Deltaproteobacteria bacterium]